MTITNTLSRARGLASLIVIAVTSLTFSSCAKDDSPSSASALAQQTDAIAPIYTETIELPLEASMSLDGDTEGELRALNAKVDNQLNARNQHGITLPAQLPVTIVIRSDRDAAWAHYVTDLKAVRNANGTYKLDAADRIKIKNAPALAANKTWYYMVIAGGTYNNSTKKISVDASAQETVSGATLTRDGGRSGMDFVMATRWIPIPRHANGHPKWRQEGWTTAQANSQKVNLYPLGVLCRATLRLDENYKSVVATGAATTLRVGRLRVVSTGLSFKGEFDLSVGKLPTNYTSASKPQLTWTNTQTPLAAGAREYLHTDRSVNEYEKVFVGANPTSSPVLLVSGTQSAPIFSSNALPTKASKKTLPSGVQALVFWAMPVPGVATSNIHTTLIAESGTTSNPKVLAPSHTYIYGKKHGKAATSGSTIYFDGVYYNPYTPLDYMAEYNVVRKNPGQWRVGGSVPSGITNQWASDHGRNSFTGVTTVEARTTNLSSGGRAYKLPTEAQWNSVIPSFNNSQSIVLGATRVNFVTNAQRTIQLGAQTFEKISYDAIKRSGTEVMYVLDLKSLGGNAKRMVAYRHELMDNPAALDKVDGLTIPANLTNSPRFGRAVAGAKPVDFIPTAKYIQIKAIHLGASYLGTIEDISNEAFWNDATKRPDIRYVPIAYDYLEVYSTTNRRTVPFIQNPVSFYSFSDKTNGAVGFSRHAGGSIWQPYVPAQVNQQAGLNALRVSVRPFTDQERP